jgi:hypothetical protein
LLYDAAMGCMVDSVNCDFDSVMLCLIGDGLLCPLLCQRIL